MKKILLIIALFGFIQLGFSQSVSTDAATGISYHDATLNGTFTNCNGGWLFNAKFEWGFSSGVYLNNDASSPNSSNVDGTTASLSLDTLKAGTTYYYRFFATDGSVTYYGSEQTFTTTATSSPTVFTGSSANISYTSFDVNSNNLVSDGGEAITEQGLVYSSTNNPPTTADSKQTYTPTGTGSYDVSLSSLTAGTTYHVRAYAINSVGTSYGSTIDVTTTSTTVPTVVIAATVDNITKIDADNTNNTISSDGGSTVTDKGVVWSSSTTTPTLADNAKSAGSGNSAFNGTIGTGSNPLTAGTKYWVRAYASNSVGDGYSSSKNFITDTDDPQLLASASNVHATDFDADWSTTTGAQGYYLDVSTVSDFSSFVSGYNNLDVGNVTHKVVSGLTANTTYYYRIRAYHDGGDDGADFTSGNSGTNSVTTLVEAPTTQVSNMKWETVNGGKDMAFNWSDGNGAATIFVMKDGSSVQDPTGGKTYTADSYFGNGDNIDGTGTYVVYNATHAKGTSNVTVSGLTSGNTYYFKAMDYNGSGNTTNYNTSAATGFNSGNSGTTGLPISLISFVANEKDGNVILNWETATEIDNDFFIVERSLDADNFTPIAKIQGAGNSNIIQKYSFTDNEAPKNKVVYYRLHQYDFDGKDEIFPSVSITLKEKSTDINSISVINNSLIVNYSNDNGNTTVIQLIDINGRSLQMAVSDADGEQSINFNLNGLSHGTYFVTMEQEGKLMSRKFVY